MKKFKIKNRQKRKYVKKNELATSFSKTQTLTVGLVPLLLMAIAFFATILMYNPVLSTIPVPTIQLSQPQLPDMPKVEVKIPMPVLPEFKFALPAMPESPRLTLPEAPKIVMPNITPYFGAAYTSLRDIFTSTTQQMLLEADTLRIEMSAFAVRTAVFLDPRPFLSAAGSITLYGMQQIGMTIIRGYSNMGQFILTVTQLTARGIILAAQTISNALQKAAAVSLAGISKLSVMIQKFAIIATQTVISGTQTAIKATVNGLTAVVWFLGTPFRAINDYFDRVGKFMAPYIAFFDNAVTQATKDLEVGGKTLMNSTSYVTTTVEHNSEEK